MVILKLFHFYLFIFSYKSGMGVLHHSHASAVFVSMVRLLRHYPVVFDKAFDGSTTSMCKGKAFDGSTTSMCKGKGT